MRDRITLVELTDESRDSLAGALSPDRSPYEDIESFLIDLQPVFTSLPPEVRRPILEMRRSPDGPGALVVRNLPIDAPLPPTPRAGGRATEKTTFISEASLIGIAQLLGEPFTYSDEKAGEIVHNVCPVPGRARSISNEGSLAPLQLHNEIVHLYPFCPTFVCLLCLRPQPDQQAPTLLVDIRDACERLSENTLAGLRRPDYVVTPPESFRTRVATCASPVPMPILQGPDASPEVTLEFNDMKGLHPEAEAAFMKLKIACAEPGVLREVHLVRGDLLIIDNRKSIHGRGTFQPAFDGRDRWLQRSYVREDLWQGRARLHSGWRVF